MYLVFYTTGVAIEFNCLACLFTFVPFAYPDIQNSQTVLMIFFELIHD